jgi:hypothetical protein
MKTEAQEETVAMLFPHRVLLTVDYESGPLRFESGVQQVPARYVDHPWLRAHGVTRFDPAAPPTPAQKASLLQAELKQVQRLEAKAQKASRIARWKQAHAQLQEARARLEAMKQELTAQENLVLVKEGETTGCRAQLAEHQGRRPDDFEDEFPEWATRDQELEAQLRESVERFRDAKARHHGLRLQAVVLNNTVNTLTFQELNLRDLARGKQVASGWEGGVTRLADDGPRKVG